MLQAVFNSIIVKPQEEEETTYGSIVVPDLGKEKPEMGEVVATSDTYNFNSDRFVSSQLSVGDKVLIPKLGSVRITVEGEEYYITKEQDIYAKFASEEPKVNVLDVLKETVVDKDFEKYNNKVL